MICINEAHSPELLWRGWLPALQVGIHFLSFSAIVSTRESGEEATAALHSFWCSVGGLPESGHCRYEPEAGKVSGLFPSTLKRGTAIQSWCRGPWPWRLWWEWKPFSLINHWHSAEWCSCQVVSEALGFRARLLWVHREHTVSLKVY